MDYGYDVIGDLHGEADALHRLLARMDYRRTDGGVYAHEGPRMAVFVGDFVDRGPDQMEVLSIVRKMISAGTAHAVMGNHELNAIAWATPDGAGGYMRPRTDKNRRQHARFLEQAGEDGPGHRDALNFFKTLPLWFEVPGLRVVHACWHGPSVDLIRPLLDGRGRVRDDAWPEALRWTSGAGAAIEILTKGPELELPEGRTFRDKDGHERSAVRVKWWDPDASTYKRAAIVMDDGVGELPDTPLEEDFRYREDVPVIFGHYWMAGDPALANDRATCVDFSVAKPGGNLSAYQWSGERMLTEANLVHVPAAESRPMFGV
jgi:hypothetical protein